MSSTLARTPLHELHLEFGARMVAFAGYEMPLSYPAGILSEHHHCRRGAALFDVSHMGQVRLAGAQATAALESLVPMDIVGLAPGKQRYALFTNEQGGIEDDLMVTRREDDLLLVVNAARKDADIRRLSSQIGHRCTVEPLPERALLALQGPAAEQALGALNAEVASLRFMTGRSMELVHSDCFVTRSGYTGEDGFEISVPADQAVRLARALLTQPHVRPCGLGARDTLRLEAGLCLYGQDIDERTTPVQAGLSWAIQKVRRQGGDRAGGYPGASIVDGELTLGASHRRVGLVGLERVPVRAGAVLTDARGHRVGAVTSGTVGPSVEQPIAMAYVGADHAIVHHEVYALVRGKPQPMRVVQLPFTPHRYVRG